MELLSEPCQHGNRHESPRQPCFNEESRTHAWGRELSSADDGESQDKKKWQRNVSVIYRRWEPSKRYLLETQRMITAAVNAAQDAGTAEKNGTEAYESMCVTREGTAGEIQAQLLVWQTSHGCKTNKEEPDPSCLAWELSDLPLCMKMALTPLSRIWHPCRGNEATEASSGRSTHWI